MKQRNWLERLPTEDLLIIAKELEVDSATALASCSRKLRLKLLSHLFQSVSLLYDVIRPQRAANKARFFLEHSALWSLVSSVPSLRARCDADMLNSRLCVVSHGAGLRINGLDLAALLCSPSLIHLDSELGRNRDRFSLKNEMAARAARLRVTRRRLRTDTSLFLIKHTPAVRHLHITGDHEEVRCHPML